MPEYRGLMFGIGDEPNDYKSYMFLVECRETADGEWIPVIHIPGDSLDHILRVLEDGLEDVKETIGRLGSTPQSGVQFADMS